MIGGKQNNGYLHGTMSPSDGTISGDRISYVYPDMETALLGRFEDRIMRDAQETNIEAITVDENGIWKAGIYSQPKPKSPHFYYEAPTNISFGSGPKRVIDPYERKLLESEATKDTMCSAKKKGVFAGRDIVADKLVSSFVGLVYGRENQLELFKKRCSSSAAKTNDEIMDCKKYALELSSRNAQINIPPEFDKSELITDEVGLGGLMIPLIPSLGHKVCKNLFWLSFKVLFIYEMSNDSKWLKFLYI